MNTSALRYESTDGIAAACAALRYCIRRGSRGLPSHKIFMVLGGMKVAFIPSPSPGPWRAQRLDSAVWTLAFGWPQLGLISYLWFPSWSRYILGRQLLHAERRMGYPARGREPLRKLFLFLIENFSLRRCRLGQITLQIVLTKKMRGHLQLHNIEK